MTTVASVFLLAIFHAILHQSLKEFINKCLVVNAHNKLVDYLLVDVNIVAKLEIYNLAAGARDMSYTYRQDTSTDTDTAKARARKYRGIVMNN